MKDDPPTGMSHQEIAVFESLCRDLFYLYNKMPPEGMPRKVVAAIDQGNPENALILFKGDATDLVKIHDVLYDPPQ